MFCIALVLLLQCLFGSCGYTFKVGGPEFVQLDLFDSLHLHNSTYQGVSLGMGVHTLSPGVIFTGDYREIMITGDWIDGIRAQLAKIGANEFTISAIVKQNPDNVGTLLAFSRGLLSALEIQSSGRKNELRVISGSTVETFPFRLADGSWHRLAISFSASQVDILVDCSPTYRRVLKFDPATAIFDSRNISIWIGQKTSSSHFLYKGVMQDLRLTFGPFGYLSQCPQMDTQCPTCSEYTALKISFASLQSQIQLLTERLNRAEARLTNVEQCECQKSCRVNDTSVFGDGSTWQQNCDLCTCKKGEIECLPMKCPSSICKNPILNRGDCCPMCLKQCYFRGRTYDHGEVESVRECVDCECKDGSMQCDKRDPEKTCPTLTCSPSEQIVVPGECCKVCPGTDYCATHGYKCHPNATCVNLQTTFTCQCKEGFSGDGLKCEDLNECLSERNHCARNTNCVNTLGGYSCECVKGFKINQFQCEDENECAHGGSNKCHHNSVCTNTKGSYSCTCNEGYVGNGFHCSPICNRTCENGGICISPDVCSCRSGWTGAQCETDIDECLIGRNSSTETGSLCPDNAICVNKPGWYLCQCREGFQASLAQDGQVRCKDIDECENEPCAIGLVCNNLDGSYECTCPGGGHQCFPGCFDDNIMHLPGSKWFGEECHVCTCANPGTISCHPKTNDACPQLCPLDISDSVENVHKCCDKCGNVTVSARSLQKKSCKHQLYQDTLFQSGDIWHFNCQTCECLDGEVDCWPIDCPPVECHNAILPTGDCCYRCPEESADDRCTHWHRNNTFSECHLLQNTIESGTRVTLPHNHCISCKCQDGELCCTYDYDCVAHASPSSFLTSPGN